MKPVVTGNQEIRAVMKNRRAKEPGRDSGLDQNNENTELKELRQSHRALQGLIALIPVENRDEFLELLQILDKKEKDVGEPQELSSANHGRILEIAARADRTTILDTENNAGYGPERRTGERRRGDRRQPVNNYGKPWTPEQIETLRTLAIQNTPIRRIALRLGRTSTAIQLKAKEIDLPLNLII